MRPGSHLQVITFYMTGTSCHRLVNSVDDDAGMRHRSSAALGLPTASNAD
jgi:hypothetical protein